MRPPHSEQVRDFLKKPTWQRPGWRDEDLDELLRELDDLRARCDELERRLAALGEDPKDWEPF